MKSYEAICVFNTELGEEKVSAIVSKIEDKIRSSKGEVTKIDKWGTRRLAYSPRKLKNVKDGNYIVIYFNSETRIPLEIRDLLRVTEGVVLYSIGVSKGLPAVEGKAPEEEKVEIAASMLERPKEAANG